jgi:predicted RND superfamily exporter protein
VADDLLHLSQKRKPMLLLSVIVLVIAIIGASRVIVDNVMIEFFKSDTDINRSDRFMRTYFGGSHDLSLVVTAGTPEEMLSPEVLGKIDALNTYLEEREPLVGKAVGFTDVIKRINQVFNVDEPPGGLSQNLTAEDAESAEGFDGFGFEDFASIDDDAVLEATDSANSANSAVSYTANDILQLLQTANAQGVTDVHSLVREVERLTNLDGYSYYEIPEDPARYGKANNAELEALIANYLILVSGGDFGSYANDPLNPTAIRTMYQLRTVGDRDVKQVIQMMQDYIDANFPENVTTLIGGGATVESAVTALIVNSQIISIAISIIMVLIILSVSYRSIIAGIIGAIPLAFAILINFAVMGFAGIKLNIGTALIASLSVGIGIDYTIHFIDTFKREYEECLATGDDYLRRTFISSGKAIIINAVSVGLGFGVLAFSRFRMLGEFGALILLSMAVSAIVSLTLIPVLLTTIRPKFIFIQSTRE